jgi:hypothetical protein
MQNRRRRHRFRTRDIGRAGGCFELAVDGLRGLGTCILVGSARAGTEVSFEMPWVML